MGLGSNYDKQDVNIVHNLYQMCKLVYTTVDIYVIRNNNT